jgi:thioredoxin reductase/Pyruvate/2-oxoacid:ferredoxin oxidoreductase delta subunit
VDIESALIASASVGATAALAGGYAAHRWRRSRLDAAALREAARLETDLARSLHPVIDPDICIGSLGCVKSCPEGDILGIVDGAAALVHGQQCIGHGRCAAACPVGAIQLVFGSSRRGVDLPEVSEFYESSRSGVYVVGELGGMGLIKNAFRQGLQAAEHLAGARGARGPGWADVAVVGAGPAGLATALGLVARGLSYRLLEQETLGGTVAHYPRRKVVMTEKIDLPVYGRFGKPSLSKEELLASLQKVIRKAGLVVEEGVKVVGIDGQDGAFAVQTSRGVVQARKVVLAIGRRGSPRKLGVPGEEQKKVVYRLIEPEQYAGTQVLVVGGGDAGVEAACQLARESDARVCLSYRGEAPKCREPNRRELEALAGAGRLEVFPRSGVRAIAAKHVDLEVGGSPRRVPNDFVIVNAGGELPTEFLEKVGVKMRRYHGEAPGARKGAGHSHALQSQLGARRKERRLALLFALLGAPILAFLAWKGWDYYRLPPLERLRSPQHALLKPAGPWGHGVGIAATAFMLSNFLYAVRKRARWLQGLGDMRSWLVFHVFVGFMSPAVIAFHAAFQSRNLLASATAASMAVVVLTGVVGRYIYGLVPAAAGKALEVADLQARLARTRAEMEPLLRSARDPARARRLFDAVAAPRPAGSFIGSLVALPFHALAHRLALWRVGRLFPDRRSRREFREDVVELERLRMQVTFFRSIKSLMRVWRILHASLAVFLVLAIAAHIGVALYLGYGLK